jgi:hypothetical protein
MSPPDANEDAERRWTDLPVDLPVPAVDRVDAPNVSTLRSEFEALVGDARPDPASIEDALSGVELPGAEDAAVEATVLPESPFGDAAGETGAADHVDGVVETGGDAVAVAAETSGDAARVVLDAGGDAVEVVVDGADGEAAEAVLEVAAAALDGL